MALFFLYSEIVRTPTGHVQVWMKALDLAKLKKLADHIGNDIVAKAIVKASKSYVPPYTTVKTLTPDQVISIRVYEEIADEALIPPTLRGLLEVDCGQKLYRELTAIAMGQSDNNIQSWKHVPPESTIEILTKLTCS